MNRLWVRLTLAFVAVTLVAVATVALLGNWSAGDQFQHYLAQRQAVESGEFTPGYLRGGSAQGGMMRGPMMMQAAEQDFLNQLRQALILGALAAGGIGVVLGLVISRTVAAPLGALADAARDFAKHRWERRAPVRGTDEIADVARAFNAMADELQRAETLRRNLMADIAHELRTPLTVMQGSLRALLDGVYPLELNEIASLYDETRLLSRLVGDLRELALAEAGQLPLKIQTVAVLPVLRAAVEQFLLVAESQETRLELVENGALPPAQTDPDRLAQVLHNLLANALRHTPGGSVTVSAASEANRIRIRIQDTGEGIPAADLPHVFDRFYQADSDRVPASGGTGLGLAIAKAWTEAMGGTIGADSTPGQGSCFWFTLQQ